MYMTKNMDKWDKIFLTIAKDIAQSSKDPSSKVGSVAVNHKRQILATGYNGFPRQIEDHPDRLNIREEKYKWVVHSELNLIYNACYTGTSLDGATLYVYGLPVCPECMKGLLQVGISRLVMSFKQEPRWLDKFELTKEMLNEARITYSVYNEEFE